jgi:hypothetical protein
MAYANAAVMAYTNAAVMAYTSVTAMAYTSAIARSVVARNAAVCNTLARDTATLLYSDGSSHNAAALRCSDGSAVAREVLQLATLRHCTTTMEVLQLAKLQ